MRYAEWACHGCVAAWLVLGAAGCASTGEVPKSGAAATASAADTTPAMPPAAPPSPAVQRAFDNARGALRAGRTDEAERGFRSLVQSNPDLGGPHANLGAMQRQADKLPEAVAELEAAVRLNPAQPVYLNQLGVAYRQLGQFDKARQAYNKAIALDPAYAAPVLNLGILYDLYLGDDQRAMDLYARYLALSPGGDPAVTKWVVELRNRKSAAITLSRKGNP
jgi:Flp pilus assembly protein TadD